MKRWMIWLAIFFLAVCADGLAQGTYEYIVDVAAGVHFSYADTQVFFPDLQTENGFTTLRAAFEVDFEFSEYLQVGILAGFNWNGFGDPVVVETLPLSLQLVDYHSDSMVFGLFVQSEPLTFGDFAVKARAEGWYHKRTEEEKPISLSIASGTATVRNWYYQLGLELLLKYQGFYYFTPFIGPQLFLMRGSMSVDEEVESISGSTEFSYRQNRLIGVTGGMIYDISDHWHATLQVSLIARLSASVSLLYMF